jgi:phosphoadenosine phosphosulfate reductase
MLPTPAELRDLSAELAALHPRAALAWAADAFPGRVALSVSFGGGGLALAHMLSEVAPETPVLFADTGFHFPETLAFKDAFVARYRLNLVELQPASDPGPLYATDPDRCCAIRKVEPLYRALAGVDVWVSALRRDQSATRRAVEALEQHAVDGHALLKLHPLAAWTRADVERYLAEHGIPRHPLLDDGYASIGCWPCTRRTAPGEDERAGRWSGTGKTECGLHTMSRRVGSAAGSADAF